MEKQNLEFLEDYCSSVSVNNNFIPSLSRFAMTVIDITLILLLIATLAASLAFCHRNYRTENLRED
jgi:hypothetical protein